MKFKVLIIILHFIILLLALVHGFFSLGYTCHKCPDTIIDGQFLDVVCFGLLLLIFFVCVAIMAKEEIPPKMNKGKPTPRQLQSADIEQNEAKVCLRAVEVQQTEAILNSVNSQLTISFSAATLYFMATALLIYVFVGYRIFVPIQLTCAILLGALHLCVGLLHFFRDRIKTLT